MQRGPEGREDVMSGRKRTMLGALLAAAAAIICGAIDCLLRDNSHEADPLAESKSPLDFGGEE